MCESAAAASAAAPFYFSALASAAARLATTRRLGLLDFLVNLDVDLESLSLEAMGFSMDSLMS